MVQEITSSWRETMNVKGKVVDNCPFYLSSFRSSEGWDSFPEHKMPEHKKA